MMQTATDVVALLIVSCRAVSTEQSEEFVGCGGLSVLGRRARRGFTRGGQKGKPVTRPGMRCDYERPFVKFLLGALEQPALFAPRPCRQPSSR